MADNSEQKIKSLLKKSPESSHDSVLHELLENTECGVAECVLLFRTYLGHLNFQIADSETEDTAMIASVFRYLVNKPYFTSIFCQSLRKNEITEEFLVNLSHHLRLCLPEKIGIGLALFDSEDHVAKMHGKNFCISLLEQVQAEHVSGNSSREKFQGIVKFLEQSEGLAKHKDAFLQILSVVQSKGHQEKSETLSIGLKSNLLSPAWPSLTSSMQKDTSSVAAARSTSSGYIGPSGQATSTSLNLETLLTAAECRGTQIEAPSSKIQDQILFIINNIASANIETKADEFAVILQEQYYPWFAQYMVMKRASIEPNFHDLYVKFLDCVHSKGLYKAIVKATYENCKVLLKSELIRSTTEERLLLKNMGSWLGRLTIGRNLVLRASEIDPKSLIIEAYEKGLLTAVIPFICKILEPCQSSIVYKPPNPWTTAILQLLAEIHLTQGLKLNIKFEVEVLFRNLSIDMRDIIPSSLLKDRKREFVGNPDFVRNIRDTQPHGGREIQTTIISPSSQGHIPGDVAGPSSLAERTGLTSQSSDALMEFEKRAVFGLPHQLGFPQGLFQTGSSQSTFPVDKISRGIPVIRNYPVITQKLSALGLNIYTQRLITLTVEKAIRVIEPGIYRLSTTASTRTVKEILLKNYSPDSDERSLYYTAHSMVASLAGGLAYITSKEKLCVSLVCYLKNLFISLHMQSEFLEMAVQIVTDHYLDIEARRIQDAAIKKATEEIDKELSYHIAMRRRKSIASSSDANLYTHHSIAVLPDPLGPAPGNASVSRQLISEAADPASVQGAYEIADHVSQHSSVSPQRAFGVIGHRLECASLSQKQTRNEIGSRARNSSVLQQQHTYKDFGWLPRQSQLLRISPTRPSGRASITHAYSSAMDKSALR